MPENKVKEVLLHGEEESVHCYKAYTIKKQNLLASDLKKESIWCIRFKKSLGEEVLEWKRRSTMDWSACGLSSSYPFESSNDNPDFSRFAPAGCSRMDRP